MARCWYDVFHILHTPGRTSDVSLRASISAMIIGVCMTLFHEQSIAQDNMTASLPNPSGVIPEVLVQAHYDNAVGTTDAASQGTVNGVLLQDIPLLRPGEVLETVPGLVVTQHSGDGKANQYFLRGYNLDHGTDLASFVEGVPVNMPTNAHGQGYSDLNFLIPELVDRINYLKGPYFASQGDFSAAGAVDIRYRNSLPQNLINVTLGEDDYRRVLVAGSVPLGAIPAGSGAAAAEGGPVLLAALELLGENGPWVSPENLRKKNALLRLSDGAAERGWSIDAQYYDARWNSTDQVPLSLITSGALPRYGAVDPSDGGDTGRAILSGEWHEKDAVGYRRISAFYEYYRLRLFSDFTLFENRESLAPIDGNPPIYAPNPLLPTDQFEQFEHRNIGGARYVEGWNHTLAGHDSITEAGIQARFDAVQVGLNDTQQRAVFANVSADAVRETSVGAYVQNTTTWMPWLRSLVGLREQGLWLNQTDALYAANSGSANGELLLPKVALVFGPWARTEFFLNAGRGFHSNDARGVIDTVDPTTRSASSPVPALVSAVGYEIGARTEAVHGLQSSLAVWVLNSNSELVYNADSDVGSTTPNGASRRYGVEWNNHMVLGQHFLIDADLAWTHARYVDANANGAAGNEIPNAVPEVALMRATVKDFGPWTAAVEERYIGSYPASQDGTITSPSSLVTNIRVQRQLSSSVKLSLDVLNAFDVKYFDIVYQQDYRTSPTAPVVPSGISVHPGEPREFRVNLNVAF
jgi:outer membrane receptor for Fe3+-dicitrate